MNKASTSVGAVEWPVTVQSGGIKTTIMVILIALCVIALLAIINWTQAPRLVDKITKNKWGLEAKFNAMDGVTLGDYRRKSIIGTSILIVITMLVGMFLPAFGQETLSFSQFTDHYNVEYVRPDVKFNRSLLSSNGGKFRVDNSKNGVYPVIFKVTGADMESTGNIMLDQGKARLAPDRTGSGLKVTHDRFLF